MFVLLIPIHVKVCYFKSKCSFGRVVDFIKVLGPQRGHAKVEPVLGYCCAIIKLKLKPF